MDTNIMMPSWSNRMYVGKKPQPLAIRLQKVEALLWPGTVFSSGDSDKEDKA
jgi:hypothetical protein